MFPFFHRMNAIITTQIEKKAAKQKSFFLGVAGSGRIPCESKAFHELTSSSPASDLLFAENPRTGAKLSEAMYSNFDVYPKRLLSLVDAAQATSGVCVCVCVCVCQQQQHEQ